MEAWRRVVCAEVLGPEEICALRCVCKLLAAAVDALSTSAFGVAMAQLSSCKDRRLLWALLPHAAAICAHTSVLQGRIRALIQLLRDQPDVERAHAEAWRQALDLADGKAVVVVNDAARSDVKCLVSAFLLQPRIASRCTVVVSSARDPSWREVVRGAQVFEILDVPYLFGIQTLPEQTNDPTYIHWRKWLEHAVHLREFLHDPVTKEFLDLSVNTAQLLPDAGDDGDNSNGSTISYLPGQSQLWWAIAATSHLGWVLAKDKLWRCVLQSWPVQFWIEWVCQWTAEDVACIKGSKQRQMIEDLLADWQAVEGRIHELPHKFILALQAEELLNTPDVVLHATAGLLRDGQISFDEVRPLVHKCAQLERLVRPLYCSLQSKVVAHAFARNPALSVDRLEQFVSLCFLSGQPFVSLRVWLRFVRPMPWAPDTHKALLDEVHASTMIDRLVAFSARSVMLSFQGPEEWCEQVRAAAGGGASADVISAVLRLLHLSEERRCLPTNDVAIDDDCFAMQIEAFDFVPLDEWRVVNDTTNALLAAALTHRDAAEEDEVDGAHFDWCG